VAAPHYLSRREIDELFADNEAYLGELLERQREPRAALRPIIDELKEVNAGVIKAEQAVAKWSQQQPG